MEAPSRSVRLGSGKTIPARQRRFHRRPAVPGSRPLVCCLLLFFLPVSPTATDASSPTPPPSSPLQESGELASRVRGRGCVRRRSTSTTLSRRARARVSMADGEPSLTRWTFEDFVVHYEARFGLRREADGDDAPPPRGSDHGASRPATARANGGADLAVFEQFERMERKVEISNGAIEDGPLQKSLLPSFESAEMRNLAETLLRDIIRGSPDVKWESIKGLENAKRLLKEAVVMPIKYPKYFTGLLSPWKGILLFGPPGTGKMDGLTKTDELVFVLAATNLPWELDAAMLRRLEKRILVPLPEPDARHAMFEELLPYTPGTMEIPYDVLVEKTEGYSGSDIRLVCKEAAMQPLRRVMAVLEGRKEEVPEGGKSCLYLYVWVAPSVFRIENRTFSGGHVAELPEVGPVTTEDIELALRNTRPSAHLHAHRYEKFNQDYGSHVHG
ncbi:P-loop containing nucleoside triphosphate hydrolase superfamily protein [Zea mays]|uniref:p-loop containing nucleoside triphosphate hydrolase superfamily protein n=1 Tax=Zea mays TaxID=4577 RepID=A0A1D6G1C9_MAIZE|nr:P-loop containing nucleoside triphosphate hydrolase superfamily protein [Zea mays]